MISAAWVCLFSPLAAAVLITLGGTRWSRKAAGYLATLSVAVSFVAACVSFISILGEPAEDRSHLSTEWTWLTAGDFAHGFARLRPVPAVPDAQLLLPHPDLRAALLTAEFAQIVKDFSNTWRRGLERLSANRRG